MNHIFSPTGRRVLPLFATVTVAVLFFATTAYAQSKLTSFTDVSAGAWYEEAVRELIDAGALDSSPSRFRPNDEATRAEMVELLVRLRDEPLLSPSRASFDDVSPSSSFYRFFETAGHLGWVRGDRNCYGMSACSARPYSGVNRAEAATLLMRVYELPSTGKAPVFSDNRNVNMWYHDIIQTAADHCVLQGDDYTKLVRPASGMNRAEMITMFQRASSSMTYGIDCGTVTPVQGEISSAVALSSTRVRLVFTTDLHNVRATDKGRYTVNAVGGGSISVTSAVLVDDNIVDLTLASALNSQTSYRVNAVDLTTNAGVEFTSSRTFLYTSSETVVLSVSALSATRVRVVFNADMSSATTGSASRYALRVVSTDAPVGINTAVMVDNRTVELTLSSALQTNVPYLLNVNDVLTQAGLHFYGSSTFTFGELAPDLSSVTPMTATMLRLAFSTDLQQAMSESVTHYRVTSNGRDIVVTNAHLVSNRFVDLTLGEVMESQRNYVVTVTDLKSAGGIMFSDTASTLYVGNDVRFASTLIGAKEVPPVTVALSGTGTFTLTSTGLAYQLTLINMSGSVVTGAHFHRGATGVNGPVLHTITIVGNRATGSWTGLTEQDRNDLIAGGIYVNVHTQAHPDGAIRGQVTKL